MIPGVGGDLLSGYEPDEEVAHDDPALQSVVEDTKRRPAQSCHYAPEGHCVSLCLLVLLCCRRFQCGDPWSVGRVLRDLYGELPSNNHREWWLHRLHWLHHRLSHRRASFDELEGMLGLRPPQDTQGRFDHIHTHTHGHACPCRSFQHVPVSTTSFGPRACHVFLGSDDRTVCMEPACPGHAYCVAHRHALLNANPEEHQADCNRPVQWPALPLPRVPRRKPRHPIHVDDVEPSAKRPRRSLSD